MRAGAVVTGVLLAVRRKGEPPFVADQMPVLASFADQAALVLQLAENQRSLRLLDVLEDRDRVARDLHEHVIQRLFVTGMSLQGSLRRITGKEVRGRVTTAMEQLDQTVREIRTSIFDLQSAGDEGVSLRRRLLDLIAELTESTEMSPGRADVQHGHVGTAGGNSGEGLGHRRRLADHLEVLLIAQQFRDTSTDDLVGRPPGRSSWASPTTSRKSRPWPAVTRLAQCASRRWW